jgi:hypothetical protein
MDGNMSDKTTLKAFLSKIEVQYGQAKRTWVMDRGIPTEDNLAEMRNPPTPIRYLVGTGARRHGSEKTRLVDAVVEAGRRVLGENAHLQAQRPDYGEHQIAVRDRAAIREGVDARLVDRDPIRYAEFLANASAS